MNACIEYEWRAWKIRRAESAKLLGNVQATAAVAMARMKNENLKVSISFPWFLMVFDVMFDYGFQSTLLNCNKRQCEKATMYYNRNEINNGHLSFPAYLPY